MFRLWLRNSFEVFYVFGFIRESTARDTRYVRADIYFRSGSQP